MLSTKNVELGGGKISKTFNPGVHYAKINDLRYEDSPFTSRDGNPQFDIVLQLEGVDLGDDFEGFFIDYNNQSLGRYKGQIGTVKLQRYAFEIDDAKSYETRVLREVKNLAQGLGLVEQIDAIEADTVQEWIKKAAEVFVSSEVYAYFTIAGSEYTNKGGYPAYRLFLAKPDFKAKKFPYALEEDDVLPWNDELIIKKKVEATPTFDGAGESDMPFPM